jgi:hypothetical protein
MAGEVRYAKAPALPATAMEVLCAISYQLTEISIQFSQKNSVVDAEMERIFLYITPINSYYWISK